MTNLSRPLDGDLIGANFADQLFSTDAKFNQLPLGAVLRARNGRMYVYVANTGVAIADDTAVVLTEGGPPPAFTVAAGAGAYTTRAGIFPAGNGASGVCRGWVESNAI